MWFAEILRRFLRKRKIKGRVFGSRIAFRLDDENAPWPDLAYIRPERTGIIRKTYIDGPPDWTLEIVSPSSAKRDYEKERERFGVIEYWVIDPLDETVTCFRLGKNSKYKEIRPRDGKIISRVIAGFWVRSEWLRQTPLPDEDDVRREILAEANGKL